MISLTFGDACVLQWTDVAGFPHLQNESAAPQGYSPAPLDAITFLLSILVQSSLFQFSLYASFKLCSYVQVANFFCPVLSALTVSPNYANMQIAG